MKNQNDLIFSLDIGTRKVVGIVAEKLADDTLRIIDAEIMEHKSRTMLDGQIHNINEVAQITKTIKKNLENRLNIRLEKVGVAVAGRALKTIQSKIEKNISQDEEIKEDQVRNLELEAVSSVLKNASCDFGAGDYYCVGYSVVYYELDGETIGSLIGHFGKTITVDVIATFLPRVVLDSMFSVLRRAELEVINLTLEPIAAINVIIPPDLRRLNLVLLDIGAGTSDIALTRAGTIFAYGMVPEAGDEITELICEKYILDFNTAETVKRLLTTQTKVKFKDILGRNHEISSEKIMQEIQPRVKQLAGAISSFVLELNQKIPHAAILIGGGSLTPLFNKELADALGLDESNVGIRLPEMITQIEDKAGILKGPEMVTPIGISVMTAKSSGLKFIDIYINEKRYNILDMRQELDVLGALVAAGVDQMRLYGKIGQAICVEVNDKLKVLKGKVGHPAQIKLNGEQVDLSSKVKSKDIITFKEALDGQDAEGKVRDVIEEDIKCEITFNGQKMQFMPPIFASGVLVSLDTQIFDRARIEYERSVTVADILGQAGVDLNMLKEREIVVRVNRQPRVLSQSNFSLLVDGKRAALNSKVYDGSAIDLKTEQNEFCRVRDVVEPPPGTKSVHVLLNGQEHIIEGNPGKIFMNGQLVDLDEFLIDRAEIITASADTLPPTVSQLLEYLPFNFEEQRGKTLKITVNGQSAGFTTPLCEGTNVDICFEEREPLS
ncbi:MAG: cell division protein FtsA [Candidatus Omnitrophica bacterium]|nr:cell division protein FtsA [Candidatus Omnitrophota bacterium]